MKRVKIAAFVIAVAVVMATFLSLSVSAESDVSDFIGDIFHQHEYAVEEVAPTCIEDGIVIYTCECGETYNEVGAVAVGHNYVEATVNPTCEEDGYILHNCISCEDSYKDEFVPKLGHTFSDWVITVMPTAETDGIEMRDCECGHEETRDYVCEHGEVSEVSVKAATCQNAGVEHIVCDICTKVIEEKTTPVAAHSFGNWKTVVAASPNSNGEQVRSCACGLKENRVVEFKMVGSNSIYIASAGINVKYVVAPFTQAAVDTYDVVCNYTRLNKNNPIVLGHNTGSLKKLYNTKIGSYIYFSVDGVVHTYKVTVSERAVEVDNCTELQGLSTGYKLLDSYEGNTVRLYTCYQDKELGKIRWIVVAEKVS